MASRNNKKNTGKTSATVVPSIKTEGVVKAPEQTSDPLIINNIVIRNVDRTPKDVGTLRTAHQAAESIYYPNRTRYYDLLKDVELDAHLSGIWARRVSAAVNKKYVFVDKNNKPIDEVCDLIKTNEFRDMMKLAMTSISHGIEGFEFIPGPSFCYKEIERKHIKPEKKVIAINQTDYDGVPYEDLSNVWVIGKERDLGLFLKAAFYVLLKKGDFSDWAAYIEIFGQPAMVTRYDTFDEKTKIQLTKMMEDAGSALRLTIPKQADFEILDAKSSNGTGDLQSKFKDACNDELSVLILTVTETTKSSSSSGYAQSKTQSDEQFEITTDDVMFLCGLLNSEKFLSILATYGYKVDGGKFIVEEQMKPADQLVRAQVIDILTNKVGLPVDHDELYESFGLTKPADYQQQIDAKKAATEAIQGNGDPAPGNDPKKEKKPGKQQQNKPKNNLSGWDQFKRNLVDFFEFAHKD